MRLRLFFILMLLAPALNGVGALSVQVRSSSPMRACPARVEVQSCCDVKPTNEFCLMTGEVECRCGVGRSDLPKPGPTPPLPLKIGDLMRAIPEPIEQLCASLTLDESDPMVAQFERVLVAPTHNTAQAILGNWQI